MIFLIILFWRNVTFFFSRLQLSIGLWIKAPYPQRSITCLMVLKRKALYLVTRPNYLFINLLVLNNLFIIRFRFKPQTNCLGVSETQRLKLLVTSSNSVLFFLSTDCHMEKCTVLMFCDKSSRIPYRDRSTYRVYESRPFSYVH